jgi:hypothetical protein
LLCAHAGRSRGCGLSGAWFVSSDDYIGIFIVEKVIDRASCEARLSVFSPVGE